jgi:hypothetical protein
MPGAPASPNFNCRLGALCVLAKWPLARPTQRSVCAFAAADNHNIKIAGQKGFATTQLFKAKTLNFESLGIGGLDMQFDAIFRRAFASRVFPPSIVQRLGIQHVKVCVCS